MVVSVLTLGLLRFWTMSNSTKHFSAKNRSMREKLGLVSRTPKSLRTFLKMAAAGNLPRISVSVVETFNNIKVLSQLKYYEYSRVDRNGNGTFIWKRICSHTSFLSYEVILTLNFP